MTDRDANLGMSAIRERNLVIAKNVSPPDTRHGEAGIGLKTLFSSLEA